MINQDRSEENVREHGQSMFFRQTAQYPISERRASRGSPSVEIRADDQGIGTGFLHCNFA